MDGMEGHYGYARILRELWPMVLMLIVTSVYSIVDGWFISNYAGSTAFAAMNIIWPAVAIISALGLMVGAGGSALVSKTFGEGDVGRGNHIFTMLIRLTFLAGVVISAVFFVLMRPCAVALGAEGEMVGLAVTYGRLLTAALPEFLNGITAHFYFFADNRDYIFLAEFLLPINLLLADSTAHHTDNGQTFLFLILHGFFHVSSKLFL